MSNVLKLRLLLVSFSFSKGGAAIAAYKFALLGKKFADVRCCCAEQSTFEGELAVVKPSQFESIVHYVKRIISYLMLKLMHDNNPVKHSLNLFSSNSVFKEIYINQHLDCIVNLHWINNDTFSIFSLSKLPLYSIITLHDEWFYCGSEHYYTFDATDRKYIEGYWYHDKSVKGLNWNSLIWKAKIAQLKNRNDLIFTVPSNWMFNRARLSRVLQGNTIRLLPNPIDHNTFKPLNSLKRAALREELGFFEGDIVFAIGAVKGIKNPLKGFHLLIQALELLTLRLDAVTCNKIKLLVFGLGEVRPINYGGFSGVNLGVIKNAKEMSRVYGMADCTIVPSLVESFGQVAAESLSCETPVVAFRTSGITDIIQHELSGYLAEPFHLESLADCLMRIIFLSPLERANLGSIGRIHIERNFSFSVVGDIYEGIVREACSNRFRSRK